jgi:hypothetical protein
MNGARPGRVMMRRCHDECHELCLPAECALEAAIKHRNAGAHRRCCGLLGGNIAMTRTSPRLRPSRFVGVAMKNGIGMIVDRRGLTHSLAVELI